MLMLILPELAILKKMKGNNQKEKEAQTLLLVVNAQVSNTPCHVTCRNYHNFFCIAGAGMGAASIQCNRPAGQHLIPLS